MNTTPEQLREVADIIEKNLPWEYRGRLAGQPWLSYDGDVLEPFSQGLEVRRKPASFPPIPEGMTWHNPENVAAEKFDFQSWRPAVVGEVDGRHAKVACLYDPDDEDWYSPGSTSMVDKMWTYRIPISTPFPDGSYLKDGKLVKPWVPKFKVGDRVKGISTGAILGKVVAIREGTQCYEAGDGSYIGSFGDDQLTLAPWSLTRHIPGFRPLREDESWHRTDWTEEMLCDGERPLLLDEPIQASDPCLYEARDSVCCWGGHSNMPWAGKTLKEIDAHYFFKTRRPLPEPPKLVPLGPSDWLKDGPWWVRSSEEDKCPSMVVAVNVHNISYGRYGNSAHEEAVNLQRSNDGINWLPCSKSA